MGPGCLLVHTLVRNRHFVRPDRQGRRGYRVLDASARQERERYRGLDVAARQERQEYRGLDVTAPHEGQEYRGLDVSRALPSTPPHDGGQTNQNQYNNTLFSPMF